MPTYVYECRTCNQTFETEQRISEDPLRDCECGAQGSLRRLIQPTAVMFKGSGFHINDYSGSKPASTPCAKGAEAGTDHACPSCATTPDAD